MSKSDTPKVHSSFKSLESEHAPEPFVYMTKAGHRVVFPDPGEMDFEEAERWLLDMARMTNNEGLKKWLAAEDYDALRADGLNLRQLMKLSEKVQGHYHDIFGAVGESPASRG